MNMNLMLIATLALGTVLAAAPAAAAQLLQPDFAPFVLE